MQTMGLCDTMDLVKQMRLRNLKTKEQILKESPYVIDEYTNQTFLKEQPLHIEIGMGKGQFLIQQALMHKEINYLGIEKFDNVLARAVLKIPEGIPNLRVMRLDAKDLAIYFDHEVDRIYLNFSDPWPKKHHVKRRLTSSTFFPVYELISNEKVEIHFKTDNRPLFEFSLLSFQHEGFYFEDVSCDLHSREEEIITTEYEDRFVNLGLPIYYAVVSKKSVH